MAFPYLKTVNLMAMCQNYGPLPMSMSDFPQAPLA